MRQELSPKVSLAYIGGAGFHRNERELELEFQPFIPINFPIPIPIPPIAPTISESVQYDVRPFVGIESRIGLTEHTQLVPGIRLYGVDGGWLLRPAVAFGWVF